MTLARLLRAGELTAVWVPDEEHEAIRDVARARRQAKDDLVSAKLALRGFLLRHERRFPGRSAWNKTHWRWLGEQAFASPHRQPVFGEHLRRMEEAQARCDRLSTRRSPRRSRAGAWRPSSRPCRRCAASPLPSPRRRWPRSATPAGSRRPSS